MTRILVVADDLTGALDAGAPCARIGLKAHILVEVPTRAQRWPTTAQVVVVNTESRHDPAGNARTKAARAVSMFGDAERVYKKTDSTARGNIGGEVAAMARTTGATTVVYAPAYPRAGRTVRDGVLYVNNTPVAETSFGSDPRAPVRESALPALFSHAVGMDVTVCGTDDVAEGLHGRTGVLVVDGGTDADVEAVARATAACGSVLWAGPVSFLQALLPFWAESSEEIRPVPVDAPLLVVNGSLNPVSIAQARWAAEHGFEMVHAGPQDLVDSDVRRLVARRVGTALQRHGAVVLVTARERRDAGEYYSLPVMVHQAVADVVAGVCAGDALPALAIFGGDTSSAVMSALGIRELECCGFLGDGLSAARAVGFDRCPVMVTKSGGFGDESVVDVVRRRICTPHMEG